MIIDYNITMKINLKYILAGLILITLIVASFVWLNLSKGDDGTQEYTIDKLSSCEEIKTSYVGLKEEEAISKIKKENRTHRIVARDGVSFPVTMDFSKDRLNFVIDGGIIKKASCG